MFHLNRFINAPASLSVACGASLFATACSPQAPGRPPVAMSQPARNALPKAEYDDRGKLQKIEYDRNNDGRIDAWGYMDGARVVRVEVDENGDGQVDRWEYHASDAAAATPRTLGKTYTLFAVARAVQRSSGDHATACGRCTESGSSSGSASRSNQPSASGPIDAK